MGTWERMTDEGGDIALRALIEMAKFHEHVERDYAAALDVVRHAMALADLRGVPTGVDTDGDLDRRHGRLLNRMMSGRHGSWSRVG